MIWLRSRHKTQRKCQSSRKVSISRLKSRVSTWFQRYSIELEARKLSYPSWRGGIQLSSEIQRDPWERERMRRAHRTPWGRAALSSPRCLRRLTCRRIFRLPPMWPTCRDRPSLPMEWFSRLTRSWAISPCMVLQIGILSQVKLILVPAPRSRWCRSLQASASKSTDLSIWDSRELPRWCFLATAKS